MQHPFDFAAYDTSAWYALGIPVYLVLMGAEWLYGRRQRREVYGFADTLGNLSCGLGEVLIGLFLGPWLVGLYDWAFANMAIYHGWDQSGAHRALSWVVAFLAADFGYYVYHRCGHRVALLWCIHGVHHQSSRFNLTIAMRHPWLSDSYSAPFYALLPILGIAHAVLHRDQPDLVLRAYRPHAARHPPRPRAGDPGHAHRPPLPEPALHRAEPRRDVHLLGSPLRHPRHPPPGRSARRRHARRPPELQRRARAVGVF